MRPKTQGAKKSVGFSLRGTKIEAPTADTTMYAETTSKKPAAQSEFKTNKAKEYENIYQLPKFSHAVGAVINPPPFHT